MIAQAVQLMFIGMSVVFTFLTLLVVCMNLTAAIVRVLPGQVKANEGAGAPDGSSRAKLRAAIAAVSVHHNRR
ncbi:MAG: OadG family protein [Spirochaetaceae bacterium]